jgi:hypothetical protein
LSFYIRHRRRLTHPTFSDIATVGLSRCHWGMTDVRLIKHEAVPQCGSYEVRYTDGRPSRYFYWDDLPSRWLDPAILTGEQGLQQAKAVARAELDS